MKYSINTKLTLIPTVLMISAMTLAERAIAAPTVTGNTISWTDEGWHQVQDQSTYESLCQGGQQCWVPEGVYIVINHSTGERFENIPVVIWDDHTDTDDVPDPGTVPVTDPVIGAAPSPVLATGQINSYSFGDDGDYQSGVAVSGGRYQDNNDGTFTDTLTGITWLGIRDCFVNRDWLGSLEFANTLSANSDLCPALSDGSEAGDWRLPNVKELYSLVDIAADTALWGSRMPFTGTWNIAPVGDYWSSSSFRPVPDTTGWAVESIFGRPTVTPKEDLNTVWPIRVAD